MRQLKISKQITNRESQSLDKYLQEIGKVDLLTPDEEVTLAQRIKEGDQQALEKLTKANLRFVVSVAKQYQNQGLSLGDLINEGNLGLIKAAQRFDETRGFKFISYAVWWIRQSILQALAEQSRIVRLPLNRVGSLNKISKTFSELEQKFEREPSPDELAEVLDVTTAEVVDTMKISGRHVSMDAPFVQGEENSLLDVLENDSEETPDQGLMNDSLRREVQRALSTLTRHILNTLVDPWDAFLDATKKHDINLAIQKITTEHFDAAITDATAMIIDEEVPADRKLLHDLIQTSVTQSTKCLQNEVKNLRNQLKSQNTPKAQTRGRPGASKKKKSNLPSRKPPASVAAVANDSSADKDKKKPSNRHRSRSRTPSNKKKKRSS